MKAVALTGVPVAAYLHLAFGAHSETYSQRCLMHLSSNGHFLFSAFRGYFFSSQLYLYIIYQINLFVKP